MYNFEANTPRFWAELAVIALLALVGGFALRRRRVPTAAPFFVGTLLTLAYLICQILVRSAVAPATKVAWFRLDETLLLPIITAMTFFVLEYAFPGKWLKRRYVIASAIPCLAVAVAAVADPLTPLMWPAGYVIGDFVIAAKIGPAGWIALAYGATLSLLNFGVFIWLFARSPQHRFPVMLMLVGQVSGRGLFFWQYLPPQMERRPELFLLGTAVPWLLYAIGLFGFRIFDPVPVAFATAVREMSEGMVVFDGAGRVVRVNPAGREVLNLPAGRLRNTAWRDLFPDVAQPALTAQQSLETTLSVRGEQRQYALDLTPLADQRGLRVGFLVLLHDVTEQRQVQARAAEQQWAQAVLQEREQLAHELHDSLAQDLASLTMQAHATQLYLGSGQFEKARASVDGLIQVARGLQGDTRELIGNLLFVSLPAEGFSAALRQVVQRFERQAGLRVRLQAAAGAEAACSARSLSPDAAVQLLRIVQEALTNIRKHAGQPQTVVVSLAAADGTLHLDVEDDGVGFDPTLSYGRDQFGLRVMQRRAERIGGQVQVDFQAGRRHAGQHLRAVERQSTGRGPNRLT